MIIKGESTGTWKFLKGNNALNRFLNKCKYIKITGSSLPFIVWVFMYLSSSKILMRSPDRLIVIRVTNSGINSTKFFIPALEFVIFLSWYTKCKVKLSLSELFRETWRTDDHKKDAIVGRMHWHSSHTWCWFHECSVYLALNYRPAFISLGINVNTNI